MSADVAAPVPLTDDDLAAIDARVAAASRGWRAGAVDKYHVFCHNADALEGPFGERVLLRFNEHFPYEADAVFAAAAREDVPRLLAEVRRLREVIEDAAELCESQGPDIEPDHPDEYRRGQKRAAMDCATLMRRNGFGRPT